MQDTYVSNYLGCLFLLNKLFPYGAWEEKIALCTMKTSLNKIGNALFERLAKELKVKFGFMGVNDINLSDFIEKDSRLFV